MDQPLRRQQGAQLLAGPLLAGCLGSLLAGCSGTPFGDRLAGSFSSPPPTAPPGAANGVSNGAATGAPTNGAPTNGAPTEAQKLAPTAPGAAPAPPLGQSGASQGADGAAKPASKTAVGTAGPQPPAANTNLQPVPYRITLKLPLADPAAPAESVTQALRAAGLRFEVEMIERVQPASSSPSVAPPR